MHPAHALELVYPPLREYSVNFALVSMCERKVFSGTSFILVESFMSNLTGSTPPDLLLRV